MNIDYKSIWTSLQDSLLLILIPDLQGLKKKKPKNKTRQVKEIKEEYKTSQSHRRGGEPAT